MSRKKQTKSRDQVSLTRLLALISLLWFVIAKFDEGRVALKWCLDSSNLKVSNETSLKSSDPATHGADQVVGQAALNASSDFDVEPREIDKADTRPRPPDNDLSHETTASTALNEAALALSSGHIDHALKQIAIASELGESANIIHFFRGAAYLRKADWHRAEFNLSEAVKVSGNDPLPRFLRGFARGKLRRIEDAIADFEVGINLGALYIAAENWPAAMNHLDHAIDIDPNCGPCHLRAGLAYTELGEVRSAIEELTSAIDLGCETGRAYFARARAWNLLGEMGLAHADLLRATELEPANEFYVACRKTLTNVVDPFSRFEKGRPPKSASPWSDDATPDQQACRRATLEVHKLETQTN